VQLRVGVRHALTRTVDATLIVSPEQRDQLAAGPLFCGVHGVCGANAIADVGRNAVLSPVQLSVGYTPPVTRRPAAPPPPGPAWLHPQLPRWLFTGRVTAAGAGAVTGSEFSFGSLVVEASAVTGRGRATEAAARLRAGVLLGADEPLPLHVRLFGGGPLGFRGVQANRLGPAVLTAAPGDVEALGCAPVPGGCEGVVIDPRRVRLRPTGGDRLVEASVEARHWIHAQLQLAAFVDVGAVNAGPLPGAPVAGNASVASWAPGIGVLALTGFGPLRGDVALNLSGARRTPLLLRAAAMGDQLVLGDVVFDPFRFDDPTPTRELWRRRYEGTKVRRYESAGAGEPAKAGFVPL
jgi:hypothetical protein